MLAFLPGWLRGALAVTIIILNTLFFALPLFSVALLKFLIPANAWRRDCSRLLNVVASQWIAVNSATFDLLHRIDWRIEGLEGLKPDGWYLVSSNHQTWADIPILQKVFNRRIPMLKFFLKRELIWVPILGLAWWALDFPFMQRFSKEYLEKHPHMRGKDLETTRKACAKFAHTPVSVFNFLEGTRFTEQKHQQQQSPYRHLLRPKAGGAAFVLGAMGQQLHTMLDVTLIYPNRTASFWGLLSGDISQVTVVIEQVEMPPALLDGDYLNDAAFRDQFQQWVSERWQHKDDLIHSRLS